jgi:hypothetical protein
MSDSEGWVSRDALIAYAAECRVRISRFQLERWRDDDLLPRARRVHLGRGKGTQSQYPIAAVGQAIFLARLRRQHRDLDAMAWLAWTHGYPVTARVRRLLVGNLRRQTEMAEGGLDAFEMDIVDNPIDRASHRRTPKEMREVSRALRPLLLRALMEMQAGRFVPDEYDQGELAEIFPTLRAKRVNPDRDDLHYPPIGETLKFVASIMHAERMRAVLERMSDSRLEARRTDAQRLWQFFKRVAGHDFGPFTYGVFWMVIVATHASPHARWIRLCISGHLREKGFATFEAAMIAFHDERVRNGEPPVFKDLQTTSDT